jgi:hypothetical protein
MYVLSGEYLMEIIFSSDEELTRNSLGVPKQKYITKFTSKKRRLVLCNLSTKEVSCG